MEKIIQTPYPYVALQDLRGSLARLAPNLETEYVLQKEAELFYIEQTYAPEESTFYSISADELCEQTEELVNRYVFDHGGRVGILCLDRDLFSGRPIDNLYRLQFSRSPSGASVSRAGISMQPEEQIRAMAEWMSEGSFDEIVLTDDVLAFGDTARSIVDAIRKVDPKVALRYIVGIASSGGGWRGIEIATDLTAQAPIVGYTVHASEEVDGGSRGMAIPTSRDLTLLGGKISRPTSGVASSHPYLLPFSRPVSSIVRAESVKDASRDLLVYNHGLFTELGRFAGRSITIQDLVNNNYGVPSSVLEEYSDKLHEKTSQSNTRLVDLLEYSLTLITGE